MKGPKTLGDFLAHAESSDNELYESDRKKRQGRAYKGYFSRSGGTFDFIYLIRNWDKIVGKLLSQNTIPHKIQRSTLIIMTKHNVFAQELSFMGPQIIKKIESEVPELAGKVTKIKFSHANYSWDDFQKKKDKKAGPSAPEAPKLHPYSPQYQLKKKQAESLFSDIEDEETRELLMKLFIEKI